MRISYPVRCFLCAALIAVCASMNAAADDEAKGNPLDQPVIVNGDNVEYVTERSEITAEGNVKVDYKGTRLTCRKLTVNTVTKDAIAEGGVTIIDAKGCMRGDKIIYNLNTKTGKVTNGVANSPPYFCRSDSILLRNGNELSTRNAVVTTCCLDDPHYRMKTGKVRMVSGERLQTYNNSLLLGDVPCAYLPYYSQSLHDPLMHIQVSPGYRKEWGAFVLSSYHYYLNDMATGRLYLDYRNKLGLAEGAGVNYDTTCAGKGDAKVYYSNERPSSESVGGPGEFERWFVRWRHQWEIDPQTDLITEFYRIQDEKRAERGSEYNLLKDYFPREYEQDTQPPSYALLHHSFDLGSLDVQALARSSKWYDQVEKLPEVRYTLPDTLLGDGSFPLYFQDVTQAAYLQKRVTSPAAPGAEYSASRMDTYNKLSTPFKVGFVDVTPFTAMRNTAYSEDVYGDDVDPRTVWYAGTETSTKFYRIYETQPHYLGMDIDDIRHIITPTLGYSYNTVPTVKSSRLKQFDAIDAIGEDSSVTAGLSNRLQTKRKGQTVDFFDYRLTSGYIFYSVDPLTDAVTKDRLSDIIRSELEFYPYSWLAITGDSDYNHHEGYFATGNYDFVFTIADARRIGVGQRYQRKGGNELTAGLDWRLNPKWSFHTYERYQMKENAAEPKGSVRQEYGFTRDLHCWLMDLTFSHEKEHGNTVWVIFRLKAFPDAQIGLSQSYSEPHSGSH